MKQLTLYTRPGCHLCDEMKAAIAGAGRRLPAGAFVVDEVDISTDQALEQTYGSQIPVLFIDGLKAAKYRIGEDELLARLGR